MCIRDRLPPLYTLNGSTWEAGANGAGPPPEVVCYDAAECEGWADSGACEANPEFMHVTCWRSCAERGKSRRLFPRRPVQGGAGAEELVAAAREAHAAALYAQREAAGGNPYMPGALDQHAMSGVQRTFAKAVHAFPLSGLCLLYTSPSPRDS